LAPGGTVAIVEAVILRRAKLARPGDLQHLLRVRDFPAAAPGAGATQLLGIDPPPARIINPAYASLLQQPAQLGAARAISAGNLARKFLPSNGPAAPRCRSRRQG